MDYLWFVAFEVNIKDQLRIFASFALVFIIGGCTKCEDYEEEFRNKEYHMLITNKKHEDELKFVVIEGKDTNGKKAVFKEAGLDDIYNNIRLGDTLIKKHGSTVITIARKGKRAEFPSGCGDKHIEHPQWILIK